MGISSADMDRKLDEHFHYEASDDVEGVLATLTPDAEHDIVGLPTGPTRGREAARAFYDALLRPLRKPREIHPPALRDGFLVDESLWKAGAGRPFGVEGKNRPLEFRLLHVIEFTDRAK